MRSWILAASLLALPGLATAAPSLRVLAVNDFVAAGDISADGSIVAYSAGSA